MSVKDRPKIAIKRVKIFDGLIHCIVIKEGL